MLEAVLTLFGIAVCASFGLGLAARFFAVPVDPRVERVVDTLPGANCGGCGAAGCADFARGVVEGRFAPNACPVAGADCIAQIAAILGQEVVQGERLVAVVRCAGDRSKCGDRFAYNGIADCAAAALIQGGAKACGWGCLGLAGCVRACPFEAIDMVDGLAVIDRERCTGCGKCVAACPRKLIALAPYARQTHIMCSSKDPGADVRKRCTVGCIGCKKCEKAVGGQGITVTDNLAVMDYSVDVDGFDLAGGLCPTGSIQRFTDAPSGRAS